MNVTLGYRFFKLKCCVYLYRIEHTHTHTDTDTRIHLPPPFLDTAPDVSQQFKGSNSNFSTRDLNDAVSRSSAQFRKLTPLGKMKKLFSSTSCVNLCENCFSQRFYYCTKNQLRPFEMLTPIVSSPRFWTTKMVLSPTV